MASSKKPLRYTNPFNAFYQDRAHPNPQFEFSEKEIRDELSRRGLLGYEYPKEIAQILLKLHNAWLLTPEGQYSVHLQKLNDFKDESLRKIIPFYQFSQLPAEIRQIIWKMSLPGPRVLSATDYRLLQQKFHFQKNNNQENPAALFACRESREVALKKYNLVFGTPDVYADFRGGDILYFGARHTSCHFLGNLLFTRAEGDGDNAERAFLSDVVLSDLREVRTLVLHHISWKSWESSAMFGGRVFRTVLERTFSNLRNLHLVLSDVNDVPVRFNLTPGHFEIEKTHQTKQYRQLYRNFVDRERRCRITLHAARANHITKVPGENWEESYGEPYYPQLGASSLSTNVPEDVEMDELVEDEEDEDDEDDEDENDEAEDEEDEDKEHEDEEDEDYEKKDDENEDEAVEEEEVENAAVEETPARNYKCCCM